MKPTTTSWISYANVKRIESIAAAMDKGPPLALEPCSSRGVTMPQPPPARPPGDHQGIARQTASQITTLQARQYNARPFLRHARMLARTLLSVSVLWLFGSTAAFAAPTLEAPATALAGSEITFTVTSPSNPRDFVTVVPKTEPEGAYRAYVYVGQGGPLKLVLPPEPGDYELRLLGASSPYPTLEKKPLRIEAATASLEAPDQVAAGGKIQVKWTGPGHARDYVGIGDGSQPYISYVYTRTGNTLTLNAPDKAGTYELRYFLGNGDKVIASRPITVGAVSATVKGPASATAGSTFEVSWTGPNNPRDFINIVPKGAREGESGGWSYTSKGNPLTIRAPLTPGEYELRYSTGQAYVTLARTSIQVTPGKEEPGLVAAQLSNASGAGNAVEIVFDASGSMLQKIGSQRRIDIAKQTLTRLTSTTLPAGTPFAMRVFGREVDSCQTDLFMPLAPLDASAAAAQIAKLDARNGAKTPIGASLARVAQDLASVKGERLVILLTDGEETCGGDPAAEIEKLQDAGAGVRVNIVGFAIDDAKLAVTFRQWASAGNGAFFEANDAAGLANAMDRAMRPAFELLDANGQVVAEGVVDAEPVKAMAGRYTVRLKGQKTAPQPVTVKAKETTTVRF